MSIFGSSSPLRLLRETWRNPTMLAQELYAMFKSRQPIVRDGSVEIRVRPGETGLRIIQSSRGSDHTENALATSRVKAPPPPTPALPQPFLRRESSPTPDYAKRITGTLDERKPVKFTPPADLNKGTAHENPALEINGPVVFSGLQPVHFGVPPLIWNTAIGGYTSVGFAASPSIPKTSGQFGTVIGGSAQSWDISLDSQEGGTITVVAANVNEKEKAPIGLYVGPIFPKDDGGDEPTYVLVPPTWI